MPANTAKYSITTISMVTASVTSSLICSVLAVLSADDYWNENGWLTETKHPARQALAYTCISATGLMNFTYYLWVHKTLHEQLTRLSQKINDKTVTPSKLSIMILCGLAHGLSVLAMSFLAIAEAPKKMQLLLWVAATFSITSESISRFNAISEVFENSMIVLPWLNFGASLKSKKYQNIAINLNKVWQGLEMENRRNLSNIIIDRGELQVDMYEAFEMNSLVTSARITNDNSIIDAPTNLLARTSQVILYVLLVGIAVLFNYLMFNALKVIESAFQMQDVNPGVNICIASLLESPSIIMYYLFLSDLLQALSDFSIILNQKIGSEVKGGAIFFISLTVYVASFGALTFVAEKMLKTAPYKDLNASPYLYYFFIIAGGLSSSGASAYATSKFFSKLLDHDGNKAKETLINLLKKRFDESFDDDNNSLLPFYDYDQETEMQNTIFSRISSSFSSLFSVDKYNESQLQHPLLVDRLSA